jgi:hypothetical protein
MAYKISHKEQKKEFMKERREHPILPNNIIGQIVQMPFKPFKQTVFSVPKTKTKRPTIEVLIPKSGYITYDKKGRVTRHKYLLSAILKAKSNKSVVDIDNGKAIRTIKDFRE